MFLYGNFLFIEKVTLFKSKICTILSAKIIVLSVIHVFVWKFSLYREIFKSKICTTFIYKMLCTLCLDIISFSTNKTNKK